MSKKASLGIGLSSKEEDWFTSSSFGGGASREWIAEVTRWAFRCGASRLRDGGWENPRQVTLHVSSHHEVTRILDEQTDLETCFGPAEARQMMDHLFTETMQLLVHGRP